MSNYKLEQLKRKAETYKNGEDLWNAKPAQPAPTRSMSPYWRPTDGPAYRATRIVLDNIGPPSQEFVDKYRQMQKHENIQYRYNDMLREVDEAERALIGRKKADFITRARPLDDLLNFLVDDNIDEEKWIRKFDTLEAHELIKMIEEAVKMNNTMSVKHDSFLKLMVFIASKMERMFHVGNRFMAHQAAINSIRTPYKLCVFFYFWQLKCNLELELSSGMTTGTVNEETSTRNFIILRCLRIPKAVCKMLRAWMGKIPLKRFIYYLSTRDCFMRVSFNRIVRMVRPETPDGLFLMTISSCHKNQNESIINDMRLHMSSEDYEYWRVMIYDREFTAENIHKYKVGLDQVPQAIELDEEQYAAALEYASPNYLLNNMVRIKASPEKIVERLMSIDTNRVHPASIIKASVFYNVKDEETRSKLVEDAFKKMMFKKIQQPSRLEHDGPVMFITVTDLMEKTHEAISDFTLSLFLKHELFRDGDLDEMGRVLKPRSSYKEMNDIIKPLTTVPMDYNKVSSEIPIIMFYSCIKRANEVFLNLQRSVNRTKQSLMFVAINCCRTVAQDGINGSAFNIVELVNESLRGPPRIRPSVNDEYMIGMGNMVELSSAAIQKLQEQNGETFLPRLNELLNEDRALTGKFSPEVSMFLSGYKNLCANITREFHPERHALDMIYLNRKRRYNSQEISDPFGSYVYVTKYCDEMEA